MTNARVIPDLLREALRHDSDRIALIGPDAARVSMRRLAGLVSGRARSLIAAGVSRGDRVALIGDNGPEWTVAYLAIVELGATAVPLDPAFGDGTLQRLVDETDVRGALIGRRIARPGEGRVERPAVRGAAFTIDLLAPTPGDGGELGPSSEARPDGIASLLFTSGTTGRPRGVPLSHAALLAESDALSRLTPLGPHDATLALIPFHHIYGFNVGLVLPLRQRTPVGFLPSFDREELLRTLAALRPTAVCAVPAVWNAMRGQIEANVDAAGPVTRAMYRLLQRAAAPFGRRVRRVMFHRVHDALGGALRVIVSSGAPFSTEEVAFWQRLGFVVLHAYGLTETAGAVTCTRPGDPPEAGVGRPLHGVELRIDRPDGSAVGEIVLRGPTVMAGYVGGGKDETGSTLLRDGWLHTGDQGRLDERGNLTVMGRRREVIVTRGGETIYPEPVEEQLTGAAYLQEVGLVGIGEPGDERAVAVAVADAEALERDGILDLFGTVRYSLLAKAAELPPGQRPTEYRISNRPLPRTPTQKLQRVELRRRVERGEVGWGPEAMTARARGARVDPTALGDDPAARAVGRALAEVLRPGAPPVEREQHLSSDLGLDSLDRVQLVCAVERELGRRLERAAVSVPTVEALIAAADRGAAGQATQLIERLTGETDDPVLARARRIARRLRVPRKVLVLLFRALGRRLLDLELRGVDRIPQDGPFILCVNHQSYMDPYVLLPPLPARQRERLWIAAVDWLFRGPVSNAYLYAAHTFPIDNRGGGFTDGMGRARRVLEDGDALVVFPEGMRSFDGSVGPWRPGAALLAMRSGVPLVPAALAGVYQILPPGAKFPRLRVDGRRPPVRIAFGAPITPPPLDAEADVAAAAQRTIDRVRAEVMRLLAGFPPEIVPADAPSGIVSAFEESR